MSARKRNPRSPRPSDVRERTVRMVFDHQGECSSEWKTIESIAANLSIDHERAAYASFRTMPPTMSRF